MQLTKGGIKLEKPILFNTEMVQTILEGRKATTRRIIKGLYDSTTETGGDFKFCNKLKQVFYKNEKDLINSNAPYKVGDILYVRETWLNADDGYHYKANATFVSEEVRKEYGYKWKPSIHMPKVAARIFLKVTSVRVERLQSITEEGAKTEGAAKQIWYQPYGTKSESNQKYIGDLVHHQANYITGFADIWDRTLKKPNGWMYSFKENPWVWVIEFEKLEGQINWEKLKC